MIILWRKSENRDVGIGLGEFVVVDEFAYSETLTFDPVFGYLVDGVAYETTVCGGDDTVGVVGGFRQASFWFEFSVEEFVEGFVAIEVFDEEFVDGNAVLFDEVWLPA